MENQEIKHLAWTRLWKGLWFWRLFWGGALLGLCTQTVQNLLASLFFTLKLDTWERYLQIVQQNLADQVTPVPNLTRDYIIHTTSATCLSWFIVLIFAGIGAYGAAVILLRCLKNHPEGWLRAAFSGFKMPFGLLACMIRYLLAFLTPLSILTLGLYPFYTYRFYFLIKADHPDWSAGACIKASKQLMKGRRWTSFKLDCAYWQVITLLLLPFVGIILCGQLGFQTLIDVALPLFWTIELPLGIIVSQYISVGQGLLYADFCAKSVKNECEG